MTCRNCAAPLPEPQPAYCGACGQETHLHPPTLREFVHEFAAHYVALEGALWRSLGWLLVAPGRLTREYLAGRRRRYVLPLRLYLSLSLLFFLALRLGGGSAAGLDVRIDFSSFTAEHVEAVRARCDTPWICPRLVKRMEQAVASKADPTRANESLSVGALSHAPYIALAMVPVLAGWLALLYRRRREPYGMHMVAALHLQAAWFLWLLIGSALPEPVDEVVTLLMLPVVAFVALRGAYGGRWWATLLRSLALQILYGFCIAMVSSVTVLLAFLAGA